MGDAYSAKRKEWVKLNTAKDVTPDVGASILSSLKEFRERDEQQGKEIRDLEEKNKRLNTTIIGQLRSLVLERCELEARILRIDQRIMATGNDVHAAIKTLGVPQRASE